MRPVDIQNATLAGGVAIGCTANLSESPFDAIMIGVTSGLVSTIGFNFLQPYLEGVWGLHDTCGIHNLHAMPSVIGALASVILAGYKADNGNHDSAIYGQNAHSQWWRQLIGIALCITFAIVSGFIVGHLVKRLESNEEGTPTAFHDNLYWEVSIRVRFGGGSFQKLPLLWLLSMFFLLTSRSFCDIMHVKYHGLYYRIYYV